jgi:membrane-bound lytic murein transglycosylase MltF
MSRRLQAAVSRRPFVSALTFALAALLAHAHGVQAESALIDTFHDLRATDDLDGMAKRRFVRALVVYSKTFYFIDRGRERGLAAEGIRQFELHLNQRLKRTRPNQRIHVVAVPVTRDQLIPWLLEGKGDVAMVNLTITPSRQERVDFSLPFYSNASEILVTASDVPAPLTLDALGGEEVVVRRSSSYYESLLRLNATLAARGLKPVIVTPADERLEDEDLLEMVNARLIPRVVIDDYKAKFWSQIFPSLRVYPGLAVSRGAEIAWAFRKDSPKLKAAVDGFVRKARPGTALYNDAYRRYFVSTRWVKSATSGQELEKFRATVDVFRKYAQAYDFDYLLLTAQGYQESGLDQGKRSAVGAVGVMQVMPATGKEMRVGDISKLDANVHAGVKYMRELVDVHFSDLGVDPLNRTLFAIAAYNCGPTRVSQLRKNAAKRGLDPNQWFNHVERVAAERIGRETVDYVANIYKYYIAYTRVEAQRQERAQLSAAP